MFLGFGPREAGIAAVAIAVLAAAGLWWANRRGSAAADAGPLLKELTQKENAIAVYRERFTILQWEAARIRSWGRSQQDAQVQTWQRRRENLFDALMARVDQRPRVDAFSVLAKQVRRRCDAGDIASARALLEQLPNVSFPATDEFSRLRTQFYEAPLAELSRQNPTFYKAFQSQEPDLFNRDEAQLRSELATAAANVNVTPQIMLKADLLAAVAPNDPTVSEWSSIASAIDQFDNPDAGTLARWVRAQRALQRQDWQTAANEMQAILESNVRTREPFRAAYGWALLRSRPDNAAAAYPFLAEAAATGDKAARSWVAGEDYRQRRYSRAERWLEASVADGQADAVPLLLRLYRSHPDRLTIDPRRRTGLLERITAAPDAPADAWLQLGQLYERVDPEGSAGKALACYRRAASKGSAEADAAVARCALQGRGTPIDLDLARDEACRAYSAGNTKESVPVLVDLMKQAPARTADAVSRLFSRDSVVGSAPFVVTRSVEGEGVAQLKRLVARYLDASGSLGRAAEIYRDLHDPASARRYAELTAAHVCPTCKGTGKISVTVPCPTCGGSGRQICSYCGGTGFIYVPGTPPCPTCGGTGHIVVDGKLVICPTCGGTGKGKGSVIKEPCPHCDHGYVKCPDCGGTGVVVVTKVCPDCHGRGTWTLAERSGD